jgi:prevent-host-death family protein
METGHEGASTEFQQNVGRYQDAAMRGSVVITKHDRPHTVLMSAALYEVVMKGRVARRVEGLDDDTLNALANASVPATHAALDKIIED